MTWVIENALSPEQLATINAQLDEFVSGQPPLILALPPAPLRLPVPPRLAEQT